MIVSELGNIVDFQGIKTAGGAAEKSVLFNNKIKHVSKLITDLLSGSTVTKPPQRKMKAKKAKKKKQPPSKPQSAAPPPPTVSDTSQMMSSLTLGGIESAVPSAPPAYDLDTGVKITFIPFNGDEKQLTLAETAAEYKELIKEKQVSYLHELIEKHFAIKRANQRLSIQIADPGKPKELWKKRVQWSSNQLGIHLEKSRFPRNFPYFYF